MSQKCSKIIGVSIKGRKGQYDNIIADPFFSVLLGAVEAEIRRRGYFMMIYTSDDIQELIRNVLTWNVDGLILLGILHDDFVKIKSRYKNPIVLIDSYAPRDIMNYVNVGLDDEKGAYEMTLHLLECGHRRIAFLADNMEGVDYIRYIGHQRALAKYGFKADSKDLLIIQRGDGDQYGRALLYVQKLYGVHVLFGLLGGSFDELFQRPGNQDTRGSVFYRV